MTENEWKRVMGEVAQATYSRKPVGDGRFPPSLYYRFLELLAIREQPKLSVVLGVCGGGCCAHLANGCKNGTVIGIDISDDYPENMKYIYDHWKGFEFRIANSITDVQQHPELYSQVDILFIDTTHTYEQTMAEYQAWRPRLRPGAHIVLDDLDRPGMEEAFNDIPGWHIRLDEMSPGGFGVIKHV